jgi:hypothetical protein
MQALGALGGAVMQGRAAKKAAQAQEAAAQRDIQFQTETRDLIRGDLGVYREGGGQAQRALDFELGIGGRPKVGGTMPGVEAFNEGGNQSANGGYVGGVNKFRVNGQVFNTREEADAYANANMVGGQDYGGYTKTPGYDFRLNEGMNALNASHAARNGVMSGAAVRDSLKYNQDYASNEYGNFLSRLGARADTGMNAAQMSGQSSQQAAAGVSNALGNIGNAQAAGAIGRGNAFTGGIQNLAGLWNYQKNMGGQGGMNGNGNFFNGLFGGKGLGGFA